MLKLKILPILLLLLFGGGAFAQQSSFVQLNPDGSLSYIADSRGNTIPDFSAVGYRRSDRELPQVPVVKTVSPASGGSSQQIIQDAIDEVSLLPVGANGFRGAILFKKGIYNIPGTIYVTKSGIVLRGEGEEEDETVWRATGTGQRTLLEFRGSGSRSGISSTRVDITDNFVPVGAFSFNVTSTAGYNTGDQIVITRPGTEQWIQDLKMDVMEGVTENQWKANEYNLHYEREITRIEGNSIYIDNPVVMEMEDKYGGGYIAKYNYPGRISDVGVEYMRFESDYASDTDEDHGWIAIDFTATEHGWARNITSRYFGYGLARIRSGSKYITVLDSKCLDPKSQRAGSRRYSFHIAGTAQLSLIKDCHASYGRHDYVTGSRTAGPNVFVNSTAVNAFTDIGPHQRWATGTLYDNIVTDGPINVQDRGHGGGDWQNGNGNGHGWTGVTQVLWNCTAERISVQSPWVSGKNYAIAVQGEKYAGQYFSDRPDGEWELHNQSVTPVSLYEAQLNARRANLPPLADFVSFKGVFTGNQIELKWSTGKEDAIDKFELQHSTDNVNFNTIDNTAQPTNSITGGSYNYTHSGFSTGENYYVIKVTGINGQEFLSPVIMVEGALLNEEILFRQNFEQGAFSADFADSTNPGKIFFDAVGAESGAGMEINNGKLRISRTSSSAGRAFFARTTNINASTQFIKVQFKLNGVSISNSGTTYAQISFGSGFTADSEPSSAETTWERIGISQNASGTYAIRDPTGGAVGVDNSSFVSGENLITFYLNATADTQTYIGPDGEIHSLPRGRWNAWIGTVKEFGSTPNRAAISTSIGVVPLENFKFVLTGGVAVYEIADFEITSLPVGTLPVSLTSFNGRLENEKVYLNWQTAAEQNNSHFEILRSADGVSFIKLGSEQGRGTTQQLNTYNFTDYNPLAGTGYYKLLQVDFDGKSAEYGPVSIENKIERIRLSIESIKDNVLSAGYFADKEQPAKLLITDVLGRNIYSTSVQLQPGYNQHHLPFNPGNPEGIYVISVIAGEEIYSLKFTK